MGSELLKHIQKLTHSDGNLTIWKLDTAVNSQIDGN